MSAASQRASQILSVEQVLNRQPLTVAPETTVAIASALMCPIAGQTCALSGPHSASEPSNCALIVANNQLQGIVTTGDLVRLIAAGAALEATAISAVMTQPVIVLKQSETPTIFTVLAALKQHRVRQLPLVNGAGALLGIVTQTDLRQATHLLDVLKLRRVGEVMARDVSQAKGTETLLELAQRMTRQRTSGVVITETKRRSGLVVDVPVGLVTEQDILQLHALGLSLAQTPAQAVMADLPLRLVSPQETLWAAHQQMQRWQIGHVVVVNEAGGVAGMVTQASLQQLLEPMELLTEIEQLQQLSQTQAASLTGANRQLQQANQQLSLARAECQRLEAALHKANQMLEERVGLQAAQLVQTDEALRQEIQERQQVQEQLTQFFSVTPSLLCIAGLDGYFKRLNPRFAQILGYDDATLLAEPFITFVHPEDRLATQSQLQWLAAGKLTLAFENRYRCQDGRYRWFSWNATADLDAQIVYAAARDMTERKQFEQALEQERNFISAVLDTVAALVIVLDQTGKVISFNSACEQVSGYGADEIRGQQIWTILIPPGERAEVRAIFQRIKRGQALDHYESYWVRKDGGRRLIRWSNTVLKDASGNVEYVIGTGIDVTGQRQTEQNLARQHQQGQLLGEITRKIRESLEIEEILQTAVTEVRKLLACDRVVIIQCNANETGKVIQESVGHGETSPSLLHQTVSGLKLMGHAHTPPSKACACEDLKSARCSLYTAEFLKKWNAQSCVEVAIYVSDQLWGLITASQCDRPRQWEVFEIELLHQLANQMGVAIAQARLLNNLETQVKQRTHQLIQTNHQLRREIQDRIQTECALRESQQKLEGILDNADEAIISIDEQQRIVIYNQGAERIFGYAFEDVYNQSLDLLLPEPFQQIHRQHVRDFAASAQTSRPMANRRRDVFGRRKTGEVFPAEASISKLQTKTGQLFTVILKDITGQRQSEAALRRSEEQLRLTTDALPALICSVDTEQRYCFNNQTYEDWFQIPVADLRGRYVWEVMGDTYYAQVKPHIEAALSGQQVNFEAELTPPDGKTRYLLATYIPEVDEHNRIKGFFGLTNDISDRKAAERMKDEFVSVVGHELRTPLTSIHGSLKLLASKRLGTLTPQGEEFLEISLKNTQRLTRLINDVLDLERIESGRATMSMQMCALSALMLQAAQAMQAMATTQNIRLIVAPFDGKIWVDPDHIIQVLTNLLSNAIKFSAPGTTVYLSATKRKEAVQVQVKDQGRGIPPEKLKTIFERFQQVDASDSRQLGGTGLGLAICKNIVQRHGGDIWVESIPGIGSTFFFTLPDVQ
ncbi:MAG: PAS domain S-box protein [Leptolyngbya sp. SIO1E4]|nr:PAS domain S-box protein [Leptolyngbya sp. SIO1E4]